MNVRRHIEVSGIVQGVGFRPHVYRLARERKLTGEISNTPSGVTIEVQGPREKIDDFVVRLRQEAPPLAKITGLAMADLPCNGDREFRILASRRGEAVHTLISPDVAVCSIRTIDVTDIPSSTARIAGRDSRLCTISHTTGHTLPCRCSRCVPLAGQSMKTR
jgi:hydrogenase maturation protein HypF